MDLFDLSARISLDSRGFDDAIDGAVAKGKGLAHIVGSGLATAAKIGAAGLAAAGTGIAAITTQSVQAYAQYEQLIGGVDTLFGESSKKVQAFAANAYKTASMSANEYMEVVTGFSASLLQSLGGDTDKAADYADMALQDMSDNANKFGTSMESVKFAYQGFAKQNFTMLDNLKLGYGGTKSEMERLLKKANEINKAQGKHTKYQISNYSDIVEAIHVVQTEMGVTGTTAAEAGDTVSGSVGSMKAAWQNLITGIADDNADFDTLMDNFVESAAGAGEQMLPRIEKALEGAGELVEKLISVIIERVPAIITEHGPKLIDAGFEIISTIMQGMYDNADKIETGVQDGVSSFIEKVGDNLPEIFTQGVIVLGEVIAGVASEIPHLLEKVPEIVDKVKKEFSAEENVAKLKQIGMDIVKGIGEGILMVPGYLIGKIMQSLGIASNVDEAMDAQYNKKYDWVSGQFYPDGRQPPQKSAPGRVPTKKPSPGAGAGGGYGGTSVVVNQRIYSEAKTAADLVEESLYQQRRAVMGIVPN